MTPEAYNHLGKALRDQRRLAEAEACFREAARLRPDLAEAHYNLGVALLNQKRPAEAEASCREAARLLPQLAATHNTLGVALLDQHRLPEATACFERAVQLQPGNVEARNNLGNAFWHLGRFEEALASYAVALQAQPDFAEVHRNVALIRLLRGDFDRGWPEFEWRWRMPGVRPRTFSQPPWDGSPLQGRTILLYAEQGLGDTLQFIRYAQLARAQGARVVAECQRALLRLLARCPGIDQLVAPGDPLPPHDVRAPLLSLPYLFRTTLATIPAPVPYLEADPVLVEQWGRELAALPGFKIGINWQGNPHYPHDRQRSLPLQAFAPLAALPGVQLVSLQKGHGSEQLAAVAGAWPITDLGTRLDEAAGAFTDTAAVMKNLDLVVTSDTAIPHLAGTLGVPVWVALAKVPDWRFLLEREDSPWYPSMRLFRQQQAGDWGPIFRRIAQLVQQRLTGGGDSQP
jgi:Tfp pilus assembly protein PilF